MIPKLVNRFLTLPVWARYTLIAVFMPVIAPAIMFGGLLYCAHELIKEFKE